MKILFIKKIKESNGDEEIEIVINHAFWVIVGGLAFGAGLLLNLIFN